jgi:serine/threonine-protein kinase
VRGPLGSGGTAEILLGAAEGREVALKRPVAERANDPAMIALVRLEAAVLAHVRHENVVGFVELVEGEPPTLVIERLRGQTVAELASALDDALRLEVVAQAAAALDALQRAADARGPLAIVHRDVSPENLFVGTDGIVKLFDFNVARFRDHMEGVSGALQGRVAYMAPEQARSEAVAGSADVFSLGVVAWELFAGERLFWRGSTPGTLRALMEEPIPRLAARRTVPAALDEIVARMLDRAADARPVPSEILDALALLRPSPVEVRERLGALARMVR